MQIFLSFVPIQLDQAKGIFNAGDMAHGSTEENDVHVGELGGVLLSEPQQSMPRFTRGSAT
jgi:hypothetical protein